MSRIKKSQWWGLSKILWWTFAIMPQAVTIIALNLQMISTWVKAWLVVVRNHKSQFSLVWLIPSATCQELTLEAEVLTVHFLQHIFFLSQLVTISFKCKVFRKTKLLKELKRICKKFWRVRKTCALTKQGLKSNQWNQRTFWISNLSFMVLKTKVCSQNKDWKKK